MINKKSFSILLLALIAIPECQLSLVKLQASRVKAAAVKDISLGQSDFVCPNGASIYPHPECDKYYTCYSGQPTYLWKCRDDLLFDLVYDGCNWPDQTYCGDRTRPGGNIDTSTSAAASSVTTVLPPVNCVDYGFYSAYNDRCSPLYYVCYAGYPYSASCPSNGVFDPISRKCVQPSSCSVTGAPTNSTNPSTISPTTATSGVNTSPAAKTSVPTQSISTTRPSGSGFTCPSDFGNFADPNSCSKYYQCSHGVPYSFACPSGLVFNPAIGQCDWPFNVPSCR